MPEDLSREIRKMEVRLENFLTDEEQFVEGLRRFLEKFKELNTSLEKLKGKPNLRKVEELTTLRLEATKAFNEALKMGSVAEHEKSHLLESYGAMVLAMEEAFQSFHPSTP